MAAPRIAERIARLLLTVAAHRWPADLAAVMRAEWAAELACLRGRPRQMLTFAGSLAVADPPGVTLSARAATTTAAALVVLVSAALFNGVRAALHSVETLLPWSGEATLVCALLATGVLAMALAGARWAPPRPVRATLLFGLCAYAFLLAGNESAVMPFMGWRDVTPAVLTWTALTAFTAWMVHRLRASGRRRTAIVTGITGGLLAVESAAITGCLHAAHTLGISAASAPAWFPLAMLPGGTGGFGPHFPDGRATFSPLHGTGPAFHASDILLAGAATLTGPLLLCTAFLTAALLRPGTSADPQRAATPVRPAAFLRFTALFGPVAARLRAGPLPGRARSLAGRIDRRTAAGVSTAAVVLLLADRLPRSTTVAEFALPRVVDNSTVFGFGFLAQPAGRAVLAFVVALLVVHRTATRRRQPTR